MLLWLFIDGRRALSSCIGRDLQIISDARTVEQLTASGCGPGEFAARLRKQSPHYDAYCANAEAGKQLETAAREAGRRMRGETVSK